MILEASIRHTQNKSLLRFWKPALLLLGLSIWGLGYYRFTSNAQAALDTEVGLAKAIGLPVEQKDVEPLVYREDQNAAADYRRLLNCFKTPEARALDLLTNDAVGKETGYKEVRKQYVAIFGGIANLRESLASGAKKPILDFGFDVHRGYRNRIEEFDELGEAAKTICLVAYFQSQQGQVREAVSLLKDTQKLLDHMSRQPFLSAAVSEVLAEATVQRAALSILRDNPSDSVRIALLSEFAAGLGPLPDARHSISNELIFSRNWLSQIDQLDEREQRRLGSGSNDLRARVGWRMVQSRPYRSGLETRIIRSYRRLWMELPKNPADWRGVNQAFSRMDANTFRDRSMLSNIFTAIMPSFSGFGRNLADALARRNVTSSALWVLRFRAAEDHFPASLPEGASFKDPFGKDKLIYRPTASGFLLYSVGPDGVDEGGADRPKGFRGDISFAMSDRT